MTDAQCNAYYLKVCKFAGIDPEGKLGKVLENAFDDSAAILEVEAPEDTPLTETPSLTLKDLEPRLPNPATGLKVQPSNMSGPNGQTRPTLTTSGLATAQETAAAAAVIAAPIAEEPVKKARKPRRTKAQMAEAAATLAVEYHSPDAPPVAHVGEVFRYNQQVPEAAPVEEAAPVKKTKSLVGVAPTAEQMKSYVERITVYRDKILPEAGLVPTEGLRINQMIRKFISAANNNEEDLSKLTTHQWENVLGFMDNKVAEVGATELVKIIKLNIGLTS